MKKLPFLVVLVSAIALVIFKSGYLSLPTFWDETYPYCYAVNAMADHGISFLPGAIPFELYKGHPLLFHVLAAIWIKLFGNSMTSIHLFPLLISTLLVFALYKLGKQVHSPQVGAIAVVLLVTRTLFIAQSSFLLPETLLALLSVLALSAWYAEQKIQYIIWGSLLLLTKEPGIVLLFVLGIITLTRNITARKNLWDIIRNSAWLIAPLIPLLVFLVAQKVIIGLFFYPEHLHPGLISQFSFYDIFVKTFCTNLFIYYGGIFTAALFMVFITAWTFRRITLTAEQRKHVFPLLIFVTAYLVFCGFTFPIVRYLLPVLGPWYLLVAIALVEILRRASRVWITTSVVALALIQAGYAWDIRSSGDYDLGYVDAVNTYRDAIRFSVEKELNKDHVFIADQLFSGAVTSPVAGYIQPGEDFKVTRVSNDRPNEIIVLDSHIAPIPNDTIHTGHTKDFQRGKNHLRLIWNN